MKQYCSLILDSKIWGAILLIVGTCLGGAMLALPISNSGTGFYVSSVYLIFVWAVMAFCSYLILEVNLLFPPGTNLLTMATNTIGNSGKIVTIIAYFALLYNLLASYISGGAERLAALSSYLGLGINYHISIIIFTLLFGSFVFMAMHILDLTNRFFILLKLLLLIIIIAFSMPVIEVDNLLVTNALYTKGIIMLLSTSFGFGVIIPSLREYLDNNQTKLRLAVIVGSFIPLLVYLLWDLVIMGAIGTEFLDNLAIGSEPINRLSNIFAGLVNVSLVAKLFNIFSTLCLITSFFGISLSMSDFLSDSIGIKKVGYNKIYLFAATFLPPLVMVIWFQAGFIAALRYAGICCVVLHIFLPLLMYWRVLNTTKLSRQQIIIFKLIASSLILLFAVIIYINL